MLVSLVLGTMASTAANPPKAAREAGSKAERAKPNWTFTPDPKLPDVLILGDSISIGYTLEVRELLRGKANVFRPIKPDGTEPVNCSGTTTGVDMIDEWIAGRKWAAIHFNWGLHDLKHVAKDDPDKPSSKADDPVQATVEQYRRNLEAIVAKLKATGARLVFATTTPVVPGCTNPLREPDAPGRYNAAAVEVMRANGVRVNDLYAFCEPQLDTLQQPKNVHFTAAGSQALARQVASVLEEELAKAAGK
jgi:acyl-CoA thioesterase-1